MMHYLQFALLLLLLAEVVRGGSKDTLPKFPNKSGTNTNKNEDKKPPISKTDGGKSGGGTKATPQATPQRDLFMRIHDGWSACERRTSTSCGSFLQNITCVYIPDNKQVPMYFCDSLPSLGSTFQQCDHCSEDCVMTTWSAWTQCSSTCSPATRYRTRRVLTTARNGGQECGELSESEPCTELDGCEFEVHLTTYTWKIGEWSSCRQVSQQTGSRGCGIGRRLRSISCVSSQGEIVDSNQCLDNQDPRKKDSQPQAVAGCSLPCDCRTSSWSAWGLCSETCQHRSGPVRTGLQTRTREIQRLPENGGLPCPSLMEQRECEGEVLPECPRFEWVAEDWQRCQLTHDNEGLCGAGRQRRQVYCIEEGDESYIPVSEESCITSPVNSSLHQPPMKRACWVNCPVDCQLGQWQNWSPCSKSCEEGVQIRTRDVLVAPAFEGGECGPLAEAKECEFVECSWWHTSRWTSCSLNRGITDCGSGVHARVLYCMSALDELLDDEFCPGEEPPWQETCKIPCPTDCVISEWSDWGSCSKTCGKKGGMQMRSRQILAYSDLEDDSCLPETELTQYRPCNLHLSCQTYTWQVEAWGECSVNGTAAGNCDRDSGVQYREISCEKDSGVAQDETFCDPSSKPSGSRPCEVPCPADCKLSPWSALSDCSQTCGDNGHRIRSQRIVQLSANGGASCPGEANEDGVLFKMETCDNLPPCYSYQWNAGNWSECEVVGIDCGKGLQTREVHCGRSDGTTVEPGVCVREVLSTPPPSHQQCILPCAGDCLLSEWSVFGPCIRSCGLTAHTGYCRMQSRAIISIDPVTDNAEELCPHITSSDLMNYEPCDDPSFMYDWQVGAWQSCLLNEGDECGEGSEHRSILCQRSDSTFVPLHFCESSAATPPSTQAACDVPCVVDCIVSEWMAWSPCTQACGRGLKTRMRDILQQSANGGRSCPPLIDSMICIEMMCDKLEWEVSEWGPCEVIDPRSNCGHSAQVRTVSCKSGESYELECAKRFPHPDTSRHCVLPC
ncbi:thrombospondin type-1 domain-containing protein 7B-like, partial [Asterias rubens]|uniref:thrombospondin type-1 domain-containing protein 7B-like n=1 Tax=Asterias rubens TaxID=7604 RepID=UPI00145508B0